MSSAVIPLRQSAVESALKSEAFELLPWPTVCLNASAQILAANKAFALFAGAERQSLVGRHLSELVGYARHRDFARRWGVLWSRLLDRESLEQRAKLRTADGRNLVVDLAASLLRVESERVAVVGLREVSTERVAQRSARNAIARLAALSGGSGEVALLLGQNRRILVLNGAIDEVLGTSPSDALSVPFDYLIDEPSAREFITLFERVCAEPGRAQAPLIATARAPGAQGAARRLSIGLTSYLQDPRVRGVVARVRDVTEQSALRSQAARLKRRLRVFAELAADLTMLLDAGGKITFQSPSIQASLGLAPEASLGRNVLELAVEDDRPRLAEAIRAALSGEDQARPRNCLVRVKSASGEERALWVSIRNRLQDDALRGLLLTGRDVTDLVPHGYDADARNARRVELRDRMLQLTVQTRGEYSQSLANVLRAVADALRCSMVSYWKLAPDSASMSCELLYSHADHRFVPAWSGVQFPDAAFAAMRARLQQMRPVALSDTAESELVRDLIRDVRWSHVRGLLVAPVLLDAEVIGAICVNNAARRNWDDDEIGFAATAALMIALADEAAKRQQAEIKIEELAWYDPLTGLANKKLLSENLRDAIVTCNARRRRLAVMLIDLDRFGDVNDTLGHLVGDALIKSAAQVLKETVGNGGTVARMASDEFVVVVDEFEHRQEVALLAARVAQALHRSDLLPNVDTQMSASIGVALFPEHGREASTLLKNANAAVSQAKDDGRNQVSFFNPIRYERDAREAQLSIELMKAIQSESAQFVVEYQPQFEMASGRVIGLEALIRWNHPTKGMLPPDRFVKVAEESGLSERITRWVVNEVCGQILRWRKVRPGFDIPVAINVAGRELGSNKLPILVRGALAKFRIEPRMITLEITERTLVKEGEINNDVISELASLGVGLALDDFGTGYSMLGYLKRMPIQSIKIDQSFVEGIPDDADSRAIVHAMLAMARHFRLKVVAEGIETAEQAEYLRALGCECAQGYFYSRPLAPTTILEYLEQESPASH
ncbi:MAG TPA: EAL domain-containing protein [Burkholderiaceae bacterium]|nr:EAL domain-containing protein [Burkholderiaceae bacterium]